MAQSQPSVRLIGLESLGIYLLPPSDPAFVQALDPERPRGGDLLLPYAAFIKNETDKTVIAWSVRWDSVDSEGKEISQQAMLWNFHSHKSEHGIPAHTGRLVSIINGLGTRYSPPEDSLIKEVHELLNFYERQITVSITVDAVLFEDGTAIGLDIGGWIPRLKARLDAERDVATEVMRQAVAVTTLARTLGRVRETALSTLTGSQERHSSRLLIEANAARSYEEAYTLMKGYFAAQVLDRIESEDAEKGLQEVRKFIAGRRLPKTR